MFIEAWSLTQALIGLAVYGTMGLVATIWFLTRPKPLRVAHKSASPGQ